MSFETFIARRFLKIRHQRKLVPLITILAVLGVAVGVMVLIVVIAVMTGFQSELKRRILGIESHVMVMRYNDWIGDHRQVIEKIDRVQGVISSAPYVYAQGMLRSSAQISAIVLKGIDPDLSMIQVGTRGDRGLKQLVSEDDSKQTEAGIVLGEVLAEKLQVGVGDTLLLTVVSSHQNNPRLLPGMHRLKVAGLFETGMHQYDGSMGFMNIHRLQQIMGVRDTVTGIEVRILDEDRAEAVAGEITAALGMHYWATQWKQMHRNLFSMLGLQKLMMYVILTLIILVAAFNIASALIMMVKEKVRDIAILKVMGASNRSIQAIFLNKGLVIGLTGISMGCASGLILCWILSRYSFIDLPGDVYFLTTLPVRITLIDMALIILGTLLICVFASLYPAVKAARIMPVDGVRYG
ncbi:MAG: ABC transporter permease [Desulfobacteraceae bacterium]|nr:MAG: ABC transporter permease [Desulfobacteraceae bacterium]